MTSTSPDPDKLCEERAGADKAKHEETESEAELVHQQRDAENRQKIANAQKVAGDAASTSTRNSILNARGRGEKGGCRGREGNRGGLTMMAHPQGISNRP
jgi:hypothetical protein